MTELNRFQRLLISARYWLLGIAETDSQYFKVLEALEFSREHHNGERNGGDPEFIHQLGIFHHIRTLHRHLKNPLVVYTLIFLHDAVEDKNKSTGEFISLTEIGARFGPIIEAKVKKLSKEILGQKNSEYSLDVIFDDEDCGPAKGGDRVNNVSSMVGVFKPDRLERYVKETADEFLPRLKKARRKFPHQEAVYENIKLELINHLQLIAHITGTPEHEAIQ